MLTAEKFRELEVSEPTFCALKKKYAGMAVPELRRVKQLEEENRKLDQLAEEPRQADVAGR